MRVNSHASPARATWTRLLVLVMLQLLTRCQHTPSLQIQKPGSKATRNSNVDDLGMTDNPSRLRFATDEMVSCTVSLPSRETPSPAPRALPPRPSLSATARVPMPRRQHAECVTFVLVLSPR
uniref:Secreted protein n=1 Tax=Physcomitrium patens TaxID=3218 RepID=A0A2K1KCU9_PHYPA|nr:hypothetical protein PHYPA_010768 [Physcomitrium patens]